MFNYLLLDIYVSELAGGLTDLKLIRFDENWSVCEPGYYRIGATCQGINFH